MSNIAEIKQIVNIRFSHHAKRRMKLYNISEPTVIGIIKNAKITPNCEQIIFGNVQTYKIPLKIVFESNDENITIITVYPLKKGKNDENIL